jgi:hypothetical protein
MFQYNSRYTDKISALYTGDGDLSHGNNYDDIKNKYKKYWGTIDTIQVPHHGSKNSFNEELYKEKNKIFVISAGEKEYYDHPSDVIKKELSNKNLLFHVSYNCYYQKSYYFKKFLDKYMINYDDWKEKRITIHKMKSTCINNKEIKRKKKYIFSNLEEFNTTKYLIPSIILKYGFWILNLEKSQVMLNDKPNRFYLEKLFDNYSEKPERLNISFCKKCFETKKRSKIMMDKIDISDEPIKTPKEDKYGFAESAKELAKKIINLNTKGSTTISIEESWGNGKTSYCNLVKYYLKKHRKGKNIEVIDFIPFIFDTDKQLIDEFVDLLIDKALNNDINLKSKYKIQKYFKKYFSETKLNFPYNILNLFLSREKDFIQRKNEINKIIEKTGKKYIIFIDDLDRIIEKEKIISILKLIKYLSNMNNIIFILTIDYMQLINVLGTNNHGYIDKFVQLRIPTPSPNILDKEIQIILISYELNFIIIFLNNIRNLKLYENYKKLFFNTMYHNLVDFIVYFYLRYGIKMNNGEIYQLVQDANNQKEEEEMDTLLKTNDQKTKEINIDEIAKILNYLKSQTEEEKSLSNLKYTYNYLHPVIKDQNFISNGFIENSLNESTKNNYYNFLRDIFIMNKINRKYFKDYLNKLFMKVKDEYGRLEKNNNIKFSKDNFIESLEKIKEDIEKENFDNKNDIKKLIDMILNQVPDSKGGN